jgi:hypothetical protein
VPALHISGVIEGIRGEVLKSSNGSPWGRAHDIAVAALGDRAGGAERDDAIRGINRMVMWSQVIAVASTPELVSYRGFEDFQQELLSYASSSLFEDAREREQLRFDSETGLGAARRYGFGVSLDGTVPFPIIADAWSRGGIAIAILFSIVVCLMWGCGEFLVRRWYADRPDVVVLLIAIFVSSSYDRMSVYGLAYNLRYFVILFFVWCCFSAIVVRSQAFSPSES